MAECCTHTDFPVIVKIINENYKHKLRYIRLNNIYDNFSELKRMCFARQAPHAQCTLCDRYSNSFERFAGLEDSVSHLHSDIIKHGMGRCLIHFLALSREVSVYQCGQQVRYDG